MAVLALAMGVAQPAAASAGRSEAEILRRLDIMLMVTSLRCRTTSDDFRVDYGAFTRNHLGELNAANRDLRIELTGRNGTRGADRALDRISVTIANQYGAGHPWLSCAQLRQATKNLAKVEGHETLVKAADQLLDAHPRPLLALAGQ
ncbi:hypothetical protein [Novosphingobium malaysiense]|uniref:hypothetical protein n=1 Tax=Novosphingobium malaysiense TaxID=1348853 RepID=UPI000691A81A